MLRDKLNTNHVLLTTIATYQNVPVNKYRSLPPNVSPPGEQAKYDKISLQESQVQLRAQSVKSSEDDSASLRGSEKGKDAKPKKRKSFFGRKK